MLAGEVSPPRSSRLQAAKGTAARATNRATDPQGAAMPSADDRRQAVALFRYSLIREAADPALGAHERGALVRELAAQRGGLRAFGRFEAEAPNQLWTADALHGPVVAGRKAYLFAAIDDHSRALVGYRWAAAEDTLRLEAALRQGFTAREQFLVELDTRGGAADLDELNRLFGAWVEGVYHHRVHSETGQAPMERFLAGAPPRLPTPEELREAFLWAEHRQVTKQAMVSLFGNRYQVDPALVGATVELVFDPFDLGHIEVRYQQRPMGQAVPFQLGRHVHPHATPENDPQATTPRPSGIDYLAMVEQRTAATHRRRIAYASLPELPAPQDSADPAAATQDQAATGGPTLHDASHLGPLGAGLHPGATLTPDPVTASPGPDPTTTPATNIEPAGDAGGRPTIQTEDAS